MITRHHITLAMLSFLILVVAGVPGEFLPAGIMAAGVVAGSVLPDIHMKKPSRLRLLMAAYYLTRFSEQVCLPVLKFLFRNILNIPVPDRDKRLAHSLAGIASIIATMAVISGSAVFLAGMPPGWADAFLPGIVFGLALHLAADSCTKKGVIPFFPVHMMQVAGTIRPCNTEDPRIGWYHIGLCILLAGVMILAREAAIPDPVLRTLAISGIGTSIGLILFFSRARVLRGIAREEPVAETPDTMPE